MKRHILAPIAILLLALALPSSVLAERLPGSEQGGAPLVAAMTSSTGASGFASITVNPGQQQICYDITTADVTVPIIAAHIHAVATGHIAVGLFGPPSLPQPMNPLASSFSGCVSADRDTALAILMNPSAYYINLHTTGLANVMKGTLSGT